MDYRYLYKKYKHKYKLRGGTTKKKYEDEEKKAR